MPRAAAKPTRPRRRRGSINADDIIAGAFDLARRVSLDQLSMPMLAEQLDVAVTSIYWHFRKKEELLNRMTDVAADNYIRAFGPLPDDLPWPELLRRHFTHERTALLADEVVSDLLLIRTSTYSRDTTRRLFEIEEAVLARLMAAGFTAENAFRIYNAASVYTRGMIIHDRLLRLSDTPTLDSRQRALIDWSALPILSGLVEAHPLAGTSDEDFTFGLDRLIAGFAALLTEQHEKPKRGKASARH